MQQEHSISYFLGANTAEGFTSLYSEFAKEQDGGRTWYIKGGPGNGKSTFMKKAALAAENAGMNVEYAYCSGDPDSLDGIYIPELRTGYVDATSPHIQEPTLPGIEGRYIDLSTYYKNDTPWDREAIDRLFYSYRAEYTRAYELFHAAALASPWKVPGLISGKHLAAAREKALSFSERYIPAGSGYTETRRFISAYTCQGSVLFRETAAAMGRICLLDNKLGMAHGFLRQIAELCREKGCRVILCPDPLTPNELEGVLIPEADISLLAERKWQSGPGKIWRRIRLDGIVTAEELAARRDPFRKCASLRAGLLQQGQFSLRSAKVFHDELEELYRPHVDFAALDRFTKKHIKSLLESIESK